MAQDVVIDREATNGGILKTEQIGSTIVSDNDLPPMILDNGSLDSENIGDATMRYEAYHTASSTTVYKYITLKRGHKLLRIECALKNTSTGVIDTGGLNVQILRFDSTGVTALPNGTNDTFTLFSTNGTQTVGSAVFVGGDEYMAESCTYVIAYSSTNTSNLALYTRWYIKFV